MTWSKPRVKSGALRYLALRLKLDFALLDEVMTGRKGPRSYYHQESRGKKGGGNRVLNIPSASLMEIQQAIRKEVLGLIPPSPIAHGGVKKRSVVTNAMPHLENHSQISFDLEKAFDSISLKHFWLTLNDSWRKKLLCTMQIRKEDYARPLFELIDLIEIDRRYLRRYSKEAIEEIHRFLGKDVGDLFLYTEKLRYERQYISRFLPQGAPTSTAAFNLTCMIMDRRLEHLAANVGGAVTRYIDNIDFTMPCDEVPQPIINAIRRIVDESGFTINERKTIHIKRGNRPGVPLRLPGVNIIDGEISLCQKLIESFRQRLYYAGMNGDYELMNGIRAHLVMIYGEIPTRLKGVYQKGRQRKSALEAQASTTDG